MSQALARTDSTAGRAHSLETLPVNAVRAAERDLLRRYHVEGDLSARAQLAEQLLPLARSLAARYMNRSEPYDDLVQVACIGLMKAIDGFDVSRNVAFSSFATPTILALLDGATRVLPERERVILRLRFERDFTQQEIVKVIGVSQMQISRLIRRSIDRLRIEIGGDPSSALADQLGPIDQAA